VTESGRRRTRLARVLALVLAAASGPACEQARKLDPLDVVAPQLDSERERELGYEADQSLQKQVHVIDDPVVAGFANDLGRTLLAQAGRQPFVYRFRVIPDPTLNAFALPGGYIYIHSGTLLEAGSLDELAGVMGHEIGHVKLRHFARMQEQGQLPKILSTLAGLAGAVVTGQPGILVASQGINVALELRFSREFESEADREGVTLAAASGFRPDALSHFLERIVAQEHADPQHVPPYLYSHPDPDKRVDTVEVMARRTQVVARPNDALRESFEAAKARLPDLMASQGAPVITAKPGGPEAQALLAAADTAVQTEDTERALTLLREAQQQAPSDPAVTFRMGEIEAQSGHPAEAADAFRRTIELDPTRALVFYRLGEVTRDQGDAQLAVYAFEQAARRAGAAGTLRARSDWRVVTLTFPLVTESGLTGATRSGKDELGVAVERYPEGARKLTWWGRLGPRYVKHAKEMRARWLAPGESAAEEKKLSVDSSMITSTMDVPAPGAKTGSWTLEIRFEGDTLLKRSVPVGG
jgi:predicted Zn-dependent protease